MENLADAPVEREQVQYADDCKERHYRYTTATFSTKRGDIIETKTMRRLIRKSCEGCQTCDLVDYSLKEGMFPVMGNDLIVDSEYELIPCDFEIDPETGCLDDWNIKFKKVENNG